jgi:two-component system OmpR family sensor kinase
LSNSEKKSIITILLLYFTSTILLVFSITFIYYQFKFNESKNKMEKELEDYSLKIVNDIKKYQNGFYEKIKYPRYKEFESAIFDIDKNLIFSTKKDIDINFDKKLYSKDGYLYFIHKNQPYYLGTAFVVIMIEDKNSFSNVIEEIIPILFITILFIILTSLFLVKLLLKPLRDNLKLLDRFIKDTTHELNTPISAILGNIETIDESTLSPKNLKKVNRIKLGVFTISNLYQDLVYLILNDKTISQNEELRIDEILKDRVEYFEILSTSKKIKIQSNIDSKIEFVADRQKISRLIDNLISNAIKYSKTNTTIEVQTINNQLIIKDQGYGMKQEDIKTIFERYSRFDNSNQGGFGIGYNIVYSIIKEYDIKIDIESELNIGTQVTLSW